MEIGDWISSSEVNEPYRDARRLGLETNLAELEIFGFTVVEPEKAAPPGFTDRLFDALRKVVAEESPEHVPLNTHGRNNVDGRHLFHLLLKGDVFVEALLNPVVMTLGRIATGMRGRLSATVAFVKTGTAKPTTLHCDAVGVPPPIPPYGTFINVGYIFTDFREETGTLAMVPGSNRYCRHPTPIEQPKCLGGVNDDICIPLIAKPGSIVAFSGNTWHGAYPKKDKALRAHLNYGFSRGYVQTAENYDDIPDAMAEKYGPEFAQLIGKYDPLGWRSQGPNFARAEAGELARIAARRKSAPQQ